jgi:hypothetical protein
MMQRKFRTALCRPSLAVSVLFCMLSSTPFVKAKETSQQWTIYLAQDKHLDYNWCGSTTEIELRMAALLDYYLDAAERNVTRWNLDGTLWDEVYRRHRGQAGRTRLHDAIRSGRIGYAGNYAVLLWGILDTETAIRACYGALPIEQSTGVAARTALVMENPGMTWGIANVLTEAGFAHLGRGIYWLRAESYNGSREPYPLFWWQAPNGKRILTRWDLYQDTKGWGGYAEAYSLAALAGEKWSAFEVQAVGDRNSPEVFAKRKRFIEQTVARYEAYGERYPISSILLLGTGWDNWTRTEDYVEFIRKFNAESDGTIRIVDARYNDFFVAAEREIREKNLTIPTLTGSFGICWEEWAAHLAGLTAEFREAERLLRLAEASQAVQMMAGERDAKDLALVRHGFTELLKFAEHDFGGTDRRRAALSAGARSAAVTQVMDIGRALAPKRRTSTALATSDFEAEDTTFAWRGGRVVFDPDRCAVTCVVDAAGYNWVPGGCAPALGEFIHTRYRSRAKRNAVFPEPMESPPETTLRSIVCRRARHGVEIVADFERSGFRVESRWLFHSGHPWIDVTYRLRDGWTDDPQSVQFCFPLALRDVAYRYDAPGAIQVAGPKDRGGDDLPGANPELFAGVTFAAASNRDRTALLLTPDALLLRFGAGAAVGADADSANIPAQITSMPMMNLTGNDHQFGQGGQREWIFRYRLVLRHGDFDPAQAVTEAQQFATPPFLQAPDLPPAVSGLEALDLDFAGGPLLAVKAAEDNQRLILRLWNVQDRVVHGSLRLPPGWARAEICDALERPKKPLDVDGRRVHFVVGTRGITTLALSTTR